MPTLELIASMQHYERRCKELEAENALLRKAFTAARAYIAHVMAEPDEQDEDARWAAFEQLTAAWSAIDKHDKENDHA